jgi:hypothetical protein
MYSAPVLLTYVQSGLCTRVAGFISQWIYICQTYSPCLALILVNSCNSVVAHLHERNRAQFPVALGGARPLLSVLPIPARCCPAM